MSKEYVADNEGQGFATDDDDDLDSLLAFANAGEVSDDSDEDTSAYFTGNDYVEEPDRSGNTKVYTSESNQKNSADNAQKNLQYIEDDDDEISDDTEFAPVDEYADDDDDSGDISFEKVEDEYDDDDSIDSDFQKLLGFADDEATSDETDEDEEDWSPSQSTYVPTQSTYVPTPVRPDETAHTPDLKSTYTRNPEPVVEKPTYEDSSYSSHRIDTKPIVEVPSFKPEPILTPTVTSKITNRIHVKTEIEEITEAARVIRILDAYRKLPVDTRSVATQFLSENNEVIENEARVIVAVLNVDPMMKITMRSLRESKALDPVERVFYVIGLDDSILHRLGDLVTVFTDTELSKNDTKIGYARNLVREIDQLDTRAVNYIESTESILAAADEESD